MRALDRARIREARSPPDDADMEGIGRRWAMKELKTKSIAREQDQARRVFCLRGLAPIALRCSIAES
jgi:hypothetical protein